MSNKKTRNGQVKQLPQAERPKPTPGMSRIAQGLFQCVQVLVQIQGHLQEIVAEEGKSKVAAQQVLDAVTYSRGRLENSLVANGLAFFKQPPANAPKGTEAEMRPGTAAPTEQELNQLREKFGLDAPGEEKAPDEAEPNNSENESEAGAQPEGATGEPASEAASQPDVASANPMQTPAKE